MIDRTVDLDGLLERARRGNAAAWDSLVGAFERHVYSVPRRMGLGEDDAADVFQATFVALYNSLDRLQSGRALPKWLATTAARESMRLLRLRKPTTTETDLQGEMSLDELVASEDAGAEDEATRAADAYAVRAAVAAMGGRCRDLLEALFLREDEISYEDVSTRLGIPIGAIGPTRARCLEKLRKTLVSEGLFE